MDSTRFVIFSAHFFQPIHSPIEQMSVVQQLQFVIKPLAAFRPAILVSKPHPISNIRYIKLAAGDKVDEEWIEIRQKVIQRHHLFWKQNNLDFMEAKQLFFDKRLHELT
jgi:hypothetical protein